MAREALVMIRTFALASTILLLTVTDGRAAQIIPTGVEYTNDTIEQGGQLQACIVTTAIISPPAPEGRQFPAFGRVRTTRLQGYGR